MPLRLGHGAVILLQPTCVEDLQRGGHRAGPGVQTQADVDPMRV